jgi:cytochrome c oxidase accessory protein FixG
LVRGRFYYRRLVVAWALIALFVFLPFVEYGGRPVILLDIARREFVLFGRVFLPSEGVLLMLLMLTIFVGIFLLTSLVGRAWCGWGCPQTVYLEFVFRPLERLIEGRGARGGSRRGDSGSASAGRDVALWRTVLKYVAFLAVSWLLAHVFLAYFVGVERLTLWLRQSPLEHPSSFLVVLGTTALVFFDFAYFREQMCTVVCPYARLQSVLLDKRSLIVRYDRARGEPRGHGAPKKRATLGPNGTPLGACVDCGLCVAVCPTGIDIRDGLQMECVACTQCIDACDKVMDGLHWPRGLIGYTSQSSSQGEEQRGAAAPAPNAVAEGGAREQEQAVKGTGLVAHVMRARVIIYAALMAVFGGALSYSLLEHNVAELTVLRGIGAPFTVRDDGAIMNQLRVKIANRTDVPRQLTIALGDQAFDLVAPENPVKLEPRQTYTTGVFVLAPWSTFVGGQASVEVVITDRDDPSFRAAKVYRLLAPKTAPRPKGREGESK